jgi:hypothetical protein
VDELLKNNVKFILRFLDWSKKFHIHVNASNIVDRVVLTLPGEEGVNHPNVYSIRKLNKDKMNY